MEAKLAKLEKEIELLKVRKQESFLYLGKSTPTFEKNQAQLIWLNVALVAQSSGSVMINTRTEKRDYVLLAMSKLAKSSSQLRNS